MYISSDFYALSAHMQKPTFSIDIDKRRISTTGINKGKYHIKLWVTFVVVNKGVKDWKQVPYKTGLFSTAEDFVTIMDHNVKRLPVVLKDIRDEIGKVQSKAKHIFDELKVIDQNRFELFYNTTYEIQSLSGQFEHKINQLLNPKKPKISTAQKYKIALASFKKFSNSDITFNEITKEWLEDYQDWFVKPNEKGKAKSMASVGINLRHLRAIFKQAIDMNIISPEMYPFGMGKYVIPEGSEEVKKFLEPNEKDLFFSYVPPDVKRTNRWNSKETILYYQDFAKFCYYANGINFADILNLKVANDKGNYLQIERQKTKGKKKKTKRIIIPIHPEMRRVMLKHGNKTLNPNDFVFPILDNTMDAQRKFERIKFFVQATNLVLADISKALNLPVKVTTYVLRHTYANMIIQMGGTTEELQDMLGHGDKRTTEEYKHGFTLANKKKYSDGL